MTIFIELLDEGVQVWAPVDAKQIADGLFQLPEHSPTDQLWAFPPGSIVRCEQWGVDLFAVKLS